MLRATGVLVLSSIVTTLGAIVATKVWALRVGAPGLGDMALLQSLLGIVSLITGAGAGSGIIQFGTRMEDDGDGHAFGTLYAAAWVIVVIGGILGTVTLLVLRECVSQLVLGSTSHENEVPIICIALFLTLANGVQLGSLNAIHNVGAMAKCAGISGFSGSAVSCVAVLILGMPGIPWAFLASTATSCIVSTIFVRRLHRGIRRRHPWCEVLPRVQTLLRFGIPFAASTLFSAGVQLVMPIFVLHSLGSSCVGFYRAATAIGCTYIGFLLLSLAQDFYPRVLAAIPNGRSELSDLMNRELRLVLLVGTPLVVVTMSLAPVAVPVLYSIRFLPAVEILRWQLIGDIFRLSSWTMSFVALARCGSMAFLLTEIVGGVSTLVASWVCMRDFGIAGAGIGYLIGYVAYFAVVSWLIRYKVGISITSSNLAFLGFAIAVTSLLRLMPMAGFEGMVLPFGVIAAVTAGSYAAVVLANDGMKPQPAARLAP